LTTIYDPEIPVDIYELGLIYGLGVDPDGSILADPDTLKPHGFLVEGIGKPFVPNTCVRKYADEWMTVNDQDSFDMARRLCKEEGLLVGGSSGTALTAAIRYAIAHKLDERHRIVVILPDSVRNYITKQADDDWMIDNGFIQQDQYLNKDSKLYGLKPTDLELKSLKTYDLSLTVEQAFNAFSEGAEVIPIVENNTIQGVLYEGKFLNAVETKPLKNDESVKRALVNQIALVKPDTDLSIVQRFLDRHPFVFVEERKDDKIANIYAIQAKNLFKLYNKK